VGWWDGGVGWCVGKDVLGMNEFVMVIFGKPCSGVVRIVGSCS